MHDPHPLPGSDVVVDGVRLHVTRHGRPGGPPVLLIHGLPTSAYLWHDVMRDLGHSRLTIATDLVGLGRSERPPGRYYGLGAQAVLLRGLLDQLGFDRVVVVGHDLGGAVAVHLAGLAADRIAGLVLVDSPVHADAWPTRPVLPLLAPLAGEAFAAGLRATPGLARSVLARSLGASLADSRLTSREIDSYLTPLLGPDGPRGLLRFVRAVDLEATESVWRLVAAAPPPALVLWGERDHLHPAEYGRRVAGELRGAAWVPVSGAGHLLPQERPERVAEELTGFLAEFAAA
ncbi:MAG TPA: alpha/beta fold hydrolase [Mycobacteriales bacterium]|nr:alpha/beta fold hydrolase [Mycobacteriales bacterium]